MSLTLTLTLVVAFSFLVSRVLQRYAPRRLSSETAYVLLGVLVGPEVTRLLGPEELELLQPFVSLTLGLIGFLIGLPLVEQLRSAAVIEAGLLSTLLTVAGISAAAYFLLDLAELRAPWLPALTLGAAAAATSLPALRTAAERFGASGRVTDLVQSFALLGNVGAVGVSGLTLALAGAEDSAARLGLGRVEWLLASAALGVVCGLLYHFFIVSEESEERVFLATVGVVVFASGMASGMGISPLVFSALAGVTVAVAAGRGQDRSRGLEPLERPAYIVLAIFAGAMWAPSSFRSFVAPFVFFAARAAFLRVASGVSVRVIPRVETVARVGDGLVPFGGVGIAVGVVYAQVDLPGADLVLGSVLGATILAELLAIPGLRRLWVDAGEVAELAPPLSSGR